MNNTTSEKEIIDIVSHQHSFFNTGVTKSYESRIENLKKLKSALIKYESELHKALKQDLGKPEFEAYFTETGFCLNEISNHLSCLKRWMKPKRSLTSMLILPGTSHIYYSPLGVNLIISPFNYPVMLTLSPLIAAIAAGNTAVLKTSELTPACSKVLRQLISETFSPKYVAYIGGEVKETTILLKQKFDHIFFTGSPRVGSIIMSAASTNLTPVTLELGGKSPCIVHKDAKLDIAVKRIVRGKFLNAGQTCVAPDYILVHKAIATEFLNKLKAHIVDVYGEDASSSQDLSRIVGDAHFKRLCGLIDPKKVLVGGQSDAKSLFIAPTVLTDVLMSDTVMLEEIFGPVLPVLEYDTMDDIYNIVDQLPKHPLACYIYSESSDIQKQVINSIQSGGACINNCMFHVGNHYLPFGGVGESGMGAYHGFHGFERFSHKKGVLKTATWFDIPLTYAPYGKKINILRKLLK